MYIYSKTEQLQKTSRAAQAASKACLVCFAVFERCIRYLTRNTYIMVAIEGKPFWTSAYRSFKLLQNNSIRFAAAQGLSSFLLLVAKLGVTSICTLACAPPPPPPPHTRQVLLSGGMSWHDSETE